MNVRDEKWSKYSDDELNFFLSCANEELLIFNPDTLLWEFEKLPSDHFSHDERMIKNELSIRADRKLLK